MVGDSFVPALEQRGARQLGVGRGGPLALGVVAEDHEGLGRLLVDARLVSMVDWRWG